MDTADESSEKETRRDSKRKTLTKKKSKKGKGKARSSSASEGEADSELTDSELPVKPKSRTKPATSITKPSTIKSTSGMDTKRKTKAMMPSKIDDDSEEDLGTFCFNSVYRRQATNKRSFKHIWNLSRCLN